MKHFQQDITKFKGFRFRDLKNIDDADERKEGMHCLRHLIRSSMAADKDGMLINAA